MTTGILLVFNNTINYDFGLVVRSTYNYWTI